MREVCCVGMRPPASLVRTLHNAGVTLIYFPSVGDFVSTSREYVAVILCWKTMNDQQAINAAKGRGIPVVVITKHLEDAFRTGHPGADVYLEAPADNGEVTILVAKMVTAFEAARRAKAAQRAQTQAAA